MPVEKAQVLLTLIDKFIIPFERGIDTAIADIRADCMPDLSECFEVMVEYTDNETGEENTVLWIKKLLKAADIHGSDLPKNISDLNVLAELDQLDPVDEQPSKSKRCTIL